MSLDLSPEALGYLKALVRGDLRKRARNLSKIQIREGQDPEEYAEFQERINAGMRFRVGVYRDLGGDPENITNLPDREVHIPGSSSGPGKHVFRRGPGSPVPGQEAIVRRASATFLSEGGLWSDHLRRARREWEEGRLE